MLQIGSLLGCVLAGISIERLGRRFTMRLVASLSFLSGYLIIMLANSAALILLGKLKQLKASQCLSICLSIFLSQVSPRFLSALFKLIIKKYI